MKYILKTEVNENGNEVFSKERRGKGFVYLAKDETGNIGVVDKNWILRNKDSIVNVGVDKNGSIYPTEIKGKKKPEKPVAKDVKEIVEVNPAEYFIFKYATENKLSPQEVYDDLLESYTHVSYFYLGHLVTYFFEAYAENFDTVYDKVKKGAKLKKRSFNTEEKEKFLYLIYLTLENGTGYHHGESFLGHFYESRCDSDNECTSEEILYDLTCEAENKICALNMPDDDLWDDNPDSDSACIDFGYYDLISSAFKVINTTLQLPVSDCIEKYYDMDSICEELKSYREDE